MTDTVKLADSYKVELITDYKVGLTGQVTDRTIFDPSLAFFRLVPYTEGASHSHVIVKVDMEDDDDVLNIYLPLLKLVGSVVPTSDLPLGG